MITVQFYSLIRLLLKKEKVELPAESNETVGQLIHRVQRQIPTPFIQKLLDDQGELHLGTIIMVNRRNIHHLEKLQTPVQDGDIVALFPPGAGG